MSEAHWLLEWLDVDLPLWAELPAEARVEFADALELIALPGGHLLFAEGEAADALYVLVAGAIGVSSLDRAGRPRQLTRVAPPQTIGEMALLSNEPRSGTAVALRDSR